MRWVNKGKELDACEAQPLEYEQFYVFGAGDIGYGLYVTLTHFQMFAGFVDNSTEKQAKGFCGQPVKSYEWFLENDRERPIVIAATEENEKIIGKQLQKDGCKFYLSGVFLNRILPIYFYKRRNIQFFNSAQICVTERCTLKCRNCAHGCYAVDRNARDMALGEVCSAADIFLSKVDYIHEFMLIGGEPLLYDHLQGAVDYIGERYREKMGIFSIISNGTIVPSQEVLKSVRKYRMLMRISNYVRAIPDLKGQYEKLEKTLQEAKVDYRIGKAEEQWWNYGFEDSVSEQSEEQLIQKFDRCQTPCREVRDGRLYFCVMARSISDNLGYHVGETDFLDLNTLPEGDLGRRILLEYNLGYSAKGYLDMCARCYGSNSRNYPVPAAEQLR